MRNEVRKQIALAISFFGAAVLVSFPPALRAQNPGGSLLVTVQDSTGARVAGASVSLTQEKFAISRTGKADAQGEKRFESLQPGSYTVTVNVTGFAEKTAAVVVAVSSQPVLVVTLQPQSVRESVEVRDRGPSLASQPIETTSSTIKTVITSSDLDEVPLSARSFANISYLAPFTAPVEPSDPTKARITAVSFGGSSGLNVDLSVDGGDNNDDYIGGFLQNFSPEAVGEFVVRTSQFGADTSRTNGGSVIISTRLDWTQCSHSQWFARGSLDRNTTKNDLLQQGALPSTGATTTSNYYNVLMNNQLQFSPSWLGTLTLEASGFHHTKLRNSEIGQALNFPFTVSFLTTSVLDTFGDNQFATAITAFPIERDQQKYQFRYDVSRAAGRHAVRFGVNLIHEPVLRGELTGNRETVFTYLQDPSFYVSNPGVLGTCASSNPDPHCPAVHTAGPLDGSFSQSIRRLGLYAEDSWRVTPSFTLNAGLRYDTTFGLFIAAGHDQRLNPALAGNGVVSGIPHDYRKAIAPRLGVAFAPHGSATTVLRAGVGMYYNDLAQNGWVDAFTAVNQFNLANGTSTPALIDSNYHTPYALMASAAYEHELGNNWRLSLSYEHQQGGHQYRRYEYPGFSLFRSDNRSIYDGLAVQMQHSFAHRFELTANYVLAHATTWGATVGELFDYVNGVSNVHDPFGPGDHGPSGEDIRHRFVLVGVLQLPWKFEASTLAQLESARPYTMTTPFDVNGDGVANDRAVVNGVQTTLDEFRGSPFYQVDVRVSRNIVLGERATLRPFAEFFNLFNHLNPGNNYVPDISALPTPVNNPANATAFCLDPACTQTKPITSLNQLRVPAGALGDFFGPGTTVGIPFAAQVGLRLPF